jgi:membrane-associated phospholipid phosphatase
MITKHTIRPAVAHSAVPPTVQPKPTSRRRFLQRSGIAMAAPAIAGTGITLGGSLTYASPAAAAEPKASAATPRRVEAYEVRHQAALIHQSERTPPQANNGDEARYPDRRASFTKGLPHDSRGEVDPRAWAALVAAMTSGAPSDFEAIPLSPLAARKLVNPQGAFAFDMAGLDGHAATLPVPPVFAGAEAAAEVGEVYWMSLLCDVPFRDYATDPSVADAVDDLNAFSVRVGPTEGGMITPNTIFRGDTAGDRVGPFLSQFLWLDIPYGPSLIRQQYFSTVPDESFLTEWPEWLANQQGAAAPRPARMTSSPRYINDLRVLAAWVQKDVSFQSFLNAALIINRYGARALDPANPYLASRNQAGFVTFGDVHVLDLVTKAARIALEAAWYQKWGAHRRLRPEMFGGRVELQRNGTKDYGIHPDLMACDAVALTVAANANALLPQLYPDGAPLHPAYPSGHAAIAGACVTVLKAFYDEDFVIPSPVEASADGTHLDAWNGVPLTLGNELDKLASNVSMGRCAAGIHYRSDGRGVALGEQVAIGLLQDYSLTYNEAFAGFGLTRLDGRRIRIANGSVLPS